MSLWSTKDEENINYLEEMLKTDTNVYSVLGSVALGAILSVPFGLGVGAIPLVFMGAAEVIAAMFVPGSAAFRNWVKLKKRKEFREERMQYLLNELDERASAGHQYWMVFHKMRDRLETLKSIASSRANVLSMLEIESLDDSTLNYLGMWLALLGMNENLNSIDVDDLGRKIQKIEAQLETETNAVNRQKLQQARDDYLRILESRNALNARIASLEAAMITMSQTFEELYHRLMSNQNASSWQLDIETALSRMQLEEELELSVDSELDQYNVSAKQKEIAEKARKLKIARSKGAQKR